MTTWFKSNDLALHDEFIADVTPSRQLKMCPAADFLGSGEPKKKVFYLMGFLFSVRKKVLKKISEKSIFAKRYCEKPVFSIRGTVFSMSIQLGIC